MTGSKRGFLPYGRQQLDESDRRSVLEIMDSDFLTQGPAVEKFENALSDYTGARHAVVVASGTAALHLAVRALDLEPGTEGVTSPITFVATSNALAYNGLRPVFADIEPVTRNLSPEETSLAVTPATRVILPVHFAGQPCDMEGFRKIADAHRLRIIEDAAHAIGASYPNGRKVGSCCYSDMTIFSFHPVKTVTTGEGGAVLTNDGQLAERLRLLRNHGITRDPSRLSENPGPWYYEMQDLGFHYRLTDIQSALGTSQLKKLDGFVSRRREIVDQYNRFFSNWKGVRTPAETVGRSAWHLYVLEADFSHFRTDRKTVMEGLRRDGIGTQVHYIPVYRQPYYRAHFPQPHSCPNAERYYERALSIPLYPAMTDDDVRFVAETVKSRLESKRGRP